MRHVIILMINQLKSKLFSSGRLLQKSKFIVHRQQILEFWQDMSLLDKEKLLYISDNTVLEYVGRHIHTCLTNRKFREQYPAYSIKEAGQYNLFVYDCIVYRSLAEDKQMREIVTAFLLIYKQSALPVATKVHEVVSNDIITSSLLKVKASYILRLIGFFEKYLQSCMEGEKVLINNYGYGGFINYWVNGKHYGDLADYIRHIFVGVLVLLENQIIRAFVESKDSAELENRKYTEPIKLIPKPKNKACFTMTSESTFGKVDWPSLTFEVFRLRYRVVENSDYYLCYKEGSEDFSSESDSQEQTKLSEQDQNIANAFKHEKWRLRTTNQYYLAPR